MSMHPPKVAPNGCEKSKNILALFPNHETSGCGITIIIYLSLILCYATAIFCGSVDDDMDSYSYICACIPQHALHFDVHISVTACEHICIKHCMLAMSMHLLKVTPQLISKIINAETFYMSVYY